MEWDSPVWRVGWLQSLISSQIDVVEQEVKHEIALAIELPGPGILDPLEELLGDAAE